MVRMFASPVPPPAVLTVMLIAFAEVLVLVSVQATGSWFNESAPAPSVFTAIVIVPVPVLTFAARFIALPLDRLMFALVVASAAARVRLPPVLAKLMLWGDVCATLIARSDPALTLSTPLT